MYQPPAATGKQLCLLINFGLPRIESDQDIQDQ